MPNHRIGRLSEDIKRELSALLRELKDPRISQMTSILRCEVSPDGSHCKVHVTALGDETAVQESCKGLTSAAGYLRRELGAALKLRYTPELQFVEDDSIGQGAHILSMLRDPEVVKPANPANAHIDLDSEE